MKKNVTYLFVMRDAYRILNYDEKRPLGKSGYRWVDNIKMSPKETLCDCVGWIHLVFSRVQ
jgi:hypothetical protein